MSDFILEPEDEDTCWKCGGDGYVVNGCIEDCCCCLDPEEEHGTRPCDIFQGTGIKGGKA